MAQDNGGSAAIKALEDEIAAIEKAQEPTRKQIEELEAQLVEGQQIIARNRAAIDLLQGNVTMAAASRTPSRSSSGGSGQRRPRGSVKQAILEYVRERPGVTAAQVAEQVGGSKQSITSSLQKMAQDGELAKEKLDGRRVGFSVAS